MPTAEALAAIRKNAPPLIVSRKPNPKAPAVKTINPAAGPYIAQYGDAARMAVLAAASKGAPSGFVYPAAILAGLVDTGLDAIYPSDAKALRAMAPRLTIQTDPGDHGIEMLDPAATAFALVSHVPFRALYAPPELVRWAHGPGAFGPMSHGWQEINPAAIQFVQVTGAKFADVYPSPPPWSSAVDGSKDTAIHYAQLVGRPFDGPGGVYVNWYHPGSSPADFVNNAVATCGRVAGSAIGAVDQVTGAIGAAIGKIPFVGGPLEAVWDLETLGPILSTADAIAHGKSIDQAALGGLKSAIKDIHEVAPFVEAIISFVPGVGPVASGCIAAGLALASGEPIDQVMIDAAAAAIPGGAIVKAAYHAGVAVMSGHGDAVSELETAAFSVADAAGVPVPDSVKNVIATGMTATLAIAHGEKPADALINAAISQLPAAGQAAARAAQGVASGKNVADVLLQYGPTLIQGLPLDSVKQLSSGLMTGMTLGQGQMLQSLSQSQIVKSMGTLASQGAQASDAVIDSARKLAASGGPLGAYGFNVGMGMVQHQVNRYQVQATRDALSAAQKAGYDLALSLHTGRVTRKPQAGSPAQVAGAMIAHGLAGAKPAQKKVVLKAVATNPVAAEGAAAAVAKKRWAGWALAGTVLGTALGAATAGPLGLVLGAGAVGGALLGGGVDLIRRPRKPATAHGLPAEHVAAVTGGKR